MLKTLRIASIAAIAAAVGVVVFVALFGLKGDAAIEEFLQSDGIVEQIRKRFKLSLRNQMRIHRWRRHPRHLRCGLILLLRLLR